ncbi:MAG: hypothetical protein WA435_12115 [Gallionellaceae bacterium]
MIDPWKKYDVRVMMIEADTGLPRAVAEEMATEQIRAELRAQHAEDEREAAANAEKPLATTERTSLLVIIAALCDHSAIKYQERGAAATIARLTEATGAPVSDDAIRDALKKIPDALESRMK